MQAGWETPLEAVVLEGDIIHIWRTPLICSIQKQKRLAGFLSPEERERAQSFTFAEKRTRWIIARGTLRLLLGMYLHRDPTEIRLLYGEHGKPAVLCEGAEKMADIHFSLAHSADLALYAFAYGRQLGIDIERVRPAFNCLRLAQRKFAVGEYEALQALPAETRTQTFFTCWTRKEAYIKASGEGIAYGLGSFEVTLRPGEPAAILQDRRDPLASARWSMQTLAPGEGYAGALVVERKERKILYRYYEART